MRIGIHRWNGAWHVSTEKIKRVTKTMIVIPWGQSEQRYNRRTGYLCGGSRDGMAGMTNPYISDLQDFEERLANGEKP